LGDKKENITKYNFFDQISLHKGERIT